MDIYKWQNQRGERTHDGKQAETGRLSVRFTSRISCSQKPWWGEPTSDSTLLSLSFHVEFLNVKFINDGIVHNENLTSEKGITGQNFLEQNWPDLTTDWREELGEREIKNDPGCDQGGWCFMNGNKEVWRRDWGMFNLEPRWVLGLSNKVWISHRRY